MKPLCIQSDVNYNYSPDANTFQKSALLVLNQNISNSLQPSNREQIVMTKYPTDIKSLKSSCLASDTNLFSPTESSQFKSLDLEKYQIKRISPEVIENGVYLKQKYSSFKKKPEKPVGKKENKTISLVPQTHEHKHAKKCHSMANIKQMKKPGKKSPIEKKHHSKYHIKELIEKSELREKNLQLQKQLIKEELNVLKHRHEEWLQNVNQRIRTTNATKIKQQHSGGRWPWGANEQRIKELFERTLRQGSPQKQKKLQRREERRQIMGLEFLNSMNQKKIEKIIKKQSQKNQSPHKIILRQQKGFGSNIYQLVDKSSPETLQDFILQRRRNLVYNQFQDKIMEKIHVQQKNENLKKLNEDVKQIFLRSMKAPPKKHFKTDEKQIPQIKQYNHENEFEHLYHQYKQLMQQQLANVTTQALNSSSKKINNQPKKQEELKKKFNQLQERFKKNCILSDNFDERNLIDYMKNKAITLIQKVWRGFITRKKLIEQLEVLCEQQMKKNVIEEEEEKQNTDNESLHAIFQQEQNQKEETIKSLVSELTRLDENQIEQFQHLFNSFKKNPQLIEQINKSRLMQKDQRSEQEFNNARKSAIKVDSPERTNNERQQSKPSISQHSIASQKDFLSQKQIDEIYQFREQVRKQNNLSQAIQKRVNCQIKVLDLMVTNSQITPRTFDLQKSSLDQWNRNETEKLTQLKQMLEKGHEEVAKAFRKAKRDLKFVQQISSTNEGAIVQISDSSLAQSEVSLHMLLQSQNDFQEHQLQVKSIICNRDQSDFQFSIPNSPKAPVIPKILIDGHSQNLNDKNSDSSQNKQLRDSSSPSKPQQISVFSSDSSSEKHVHHKQLMLETIPPKHKIHYTNLQIESASMLILQHLIDECSEEFGKSQTIKQTLLDSQIRNIKTESNITVGIQTNLGVINEYIIILCGFVKECYFNQFIMRMNYPYGLLPLQRLRQTHGYELNEQDDTSYDYNIKEKHLALEEDFYVEFDKKYQNDPQKDPTVKDFEHIHNKAIFDAFNEILNVFRPFYLVNGMPYPWSCSEKHLTVIIINESNLEILFEKAKQKVLEFASLLCGLIQEDENFLNSQRPEQILTIEEQVAEQSEVKPQYKYLEAIQAIQNQENDYVGQIREERLQKMLLQEVQKWNNYLLLLDQ